MEQLIKVNSRLKQDITSQIQRYDTERKELTEEARGKASVEILEARNTREVTIAKAKGDLEASKMKAKQDGEELRRTTRINCDQRVVEGENAAAVKILDSETYLLDAERKAEAIVIQAEGENIASKFLVEQRRFDIEKEKAEIMTKIAGNGRKFVSGAEGKSLMDQLIPE
jgi:hypothetical protein